MTDSLQWLLDRENTLGVERGRPAATPRGGGDLMHLPAKQPEVTPNQRARPKPIRRRKLMVDGREYVALNAHDLLDATNEMGRPGMPY